MNDYQLGVSLRRQILMDLERDLPRDGRRLQALVGDLCGDSQSALVPALKYLVLTPALASAIGQQPPLPADARLQLRLQQELDQVFAAPICQRMDAVLRGLLALPEGSSSATPSLRMSAPAPDPTPTPAAAAASPAAPQPIPQPMPQPAASSSGSRGLVAVLSFMAGVLVVGVVGALSWLLLLSRQPTSTPQAPAPISSTPVEPEPEQPAPTPAPAAPELDPAATNSAIASVQQLYSDLSSGDMNAARQRFSGSAADQFDPAFFGQFQRVNVSDLRETGRNGSLVSLQGVVTFLYPDGSSQSESRSFEVETANQPPLITSSSFGQVIKTRQ